MQILQKSIENLICINKGVWDKKCTLSFGDFGALNNGAIQEKGGLLIDTDTIDNVLQGDRVSYIKMDIEGAELNALVGAKNTIMKYKPKLAICVYHKIDDLIKIPCYVKSLVPEYKLYLRVHSTHTKELVLYATT